MPIDTLKTWDEARRRSEANPDDEALRRAELEAEIAHLRMVGVDVRPRGWGGRIMPLAVILLLVAIGVGVLVNAEKLVDNQRETCERANESRVASIHEKRQAIDTLTHQIEFWTAAERAAANQPPSPLTPLFIAFVDSLEEERANKREGIAASIAAQADVAVKPGSPVARC